ncbi:MAG: hypothetical protein KC486_20995 [Myxococcales bacterium]|nr:hypothetical protein [Myxococcales bacterium]
MADDLTTDGERTSAMSELGECLATANAGYSTCADYCASKGEVCANACYYFGDSALYYWEVSDACVDGDVFDQGSVEYTSACTNDLYFDPERSPASFENAPRTTERPSEPAAGKWTARPLLLRARLHDGGSLFFLNTLGGS